MYKLTVKKLHMKFNYIYRSDPAWVDPVVEFYMVHIITEPPVEVFNFN